MKILLWKLLFCPYYDTCNYFLLLGPSTHDGGPFLLARVCWRFQLWFRRKYIFKLHGCRETKWWSVLMLQKRKAIKIYVWVVSFWNLFSDWSSWLCRPKAYSKQMNYEREMHIPNTLISVVAFYPQFHLWALWLDSFPTLTQLHLKMLFRNNLK